MTKIEACPLRLSLALLGRCYRTRLIVDKREIKDFPKLPSATSQNMHVII
jgi:hypothetical protein